MNIERIKWIDYLENNRVICTGLEIMYQIWKQEPSNYETLSMLDFVKQMEIDSIRQKNEQGSPEVWRYQNPLTFYFDFLYKEWETARNSGVSFDVCTWSAQMLDLYRVIQNISVCDHPERIPYYYEDLCNCLRALACSQMCYIVYCRGGDITPLATSSAKKGALDYEYDVTDFLRSQYQLNKLDDDNSGEWDRRSVAKVIYKYVHKKTSTKGGEKAFPTIVLTLKFPLLPQDNVDEKFCIIFQMPELRTFRPDDEKLERLELAHMRNVLVFHSSLVEVLKENMYILITSQRTVQYVEPLCNSSELVILHLTDLHVKENNFSEFQHAVENIVSANEEEHPIDLLVVTGDIVQGQCTAGELEEHYELAHMLICQLAERLWGRDDNYMRGDWRKRIVIIPGNHDYAAMNELEVISQSGSRSTSVGRPAQKEGGPMVKFAYYIQFVQKLLRIDVGEQIQNWLNHVYHYEQMRLTLLCLNTAAGSGPLRNNKVHIDRGFIDQVVNAHTFYQDSTTICLAHHTTEYLADYAMDRYYSKKIFNPDEMKTYIGEFEEILKLDPITDEIEISNRISKLRNVLEKRGLLSMEDVLMTDVRYYQENFRDRFNERCELTRMAMNRDRQMESADKESLRKSYQDLIKHARIKIILGGHIHVARYSIRSDCFEGPLFLRDGSNYGILTLKRDCALNEQHRWTQYHNNEIVPKIGKSYTPTKLFELSS